MASEGEQDEDAFYVNLSGEPIVGDLYYSLDSNEYFEILPEDEKYVDHEIGVCTNSQDKLILFYLINGIEVHAPRYKSTDVESLSVDTIHRLSLFSLDKLFAKVRIVTVLNANTVDLVVFVPASFISDYHIAQLGRRRYVRRAAIAYPDDVGFFIRVRCTLSGVESYLRTPVADKYLREQLAKEYLTACCNTHGNILYGDFLESNYIILYHSSNKNRKSINEEMISLDHRDVGTLVRRGASSPMPLRKNMEKLSL